MGDPGSFVPPDNARDGLIVVRSGAAGAPAPTATSGLPGGRDDRQLPSRRALLAAGGVAVLIVGVIAAVALGRGGSTPPRDEWAAVRVETLDADPESAPGSTTSDPSSPAWTPWSPSASYPYELDPEVAGIMTVPIPMTTGSADGRPAVGPGPAAPRPDTSAGSSGSADTTTSTPPTSGSGSTASAPRTTTTSPPRTTTTSPPRTTTTTVPRTTTTTVPRTTTTTSPPTSTTTTTPTTSTSTTTTTPPGVPTIVSFVAVSLGEAQCGSVAGTSYDLRWQVTGADHVTLAGAGSSLPRGRLPSNGSRTVCVAAHEEPVWTLTATGTGGSVSSTTSGA